MSNKEVGIYLINKSKYKEYKSNDDIIKVLENIIKTKEYNKVEIEKDKIDDYKIILYNHISYSKDTWSNFWMCKENSQTKVGGSSANNYIAFIYSQNNIFCVTTNKAYNDINKYIVYFYGVYIMSYFIKDEDKIRSATYNNIMSNFLGGSEYLGEEYQTTVDKYWDRINTNLMAELDKERLYKELELENKRKISKVRCDAKDNFTICSKIDINQLVKIIKKLDKISTDELIDKFNTIEKIKNEDEIKSLEKGLIEKIYNDYKNEQLDICIVHKNIEKFFSSMLYIFMYEGNNEYQIDTIPTNKDLKELFSKVNINSLKEMEKIKKIQLICKDSEDKVVFSDDLLNFLNIAIEINNENYLFQNNMWYKLTDNYISNLDEIFKIIKTSFAEQDIHFKNWINGTEGDYIDLYDNEENFYKIHPKLEDGIEICDLMYIDRKNQIIKMLFLKDGFGANTRDLAIQATMGVKRLLSILKDDIRLKLFFEKYIESKNKNYRYFQFKEDINTFCKNAVIVYRLPQNSNESSNIGKQSIVFAKNEIETLAKCKFTIKQL